MLTVTELNQKEAEVLPFKHSQTLSEASTTDIRMCRKGMVETCIWVNELSRLFETYILRIHTVVKLFLFSWIEESFIN